MKMMSILALREAYKSGALDWVSHIQQLVNDIRVQYTAGDPAWLKVLSQQALENRIHVLKMLQMNQTDLPLLGIPFAVKDNIDVAGWETTAACPAFGYMAAQTSPVVQQLIDAGAILIGKTNLDQFATGLVGTRSPYGIVPNPLNHEYICGGSSSGSASVVARQYVAFSLGTDTAGSGRIPAGFNHLVGYKPTPGKFSTQGVVPACRTLDCISFFTHTVEDAALLVNLLEQANTSANTPDFYAHETAHYAYSKKPKLAVPLDCDFLPDSPYAAAFQASLTHAMEMGWHIEAVDFSPFYAVAQLLYEGPWVAERYLAAEAVLEKSSASMNPVVRTIIERAKSMSAAHSFKSLYELKTLEQSCKALWEKYDAILVPTAPGHPKIEEVNVNPIGVNNQLGRYTNFVNLLGLAAIAIPDQLLENGLPFGVTLIGRNNHDWALLELAQRWQHARQLALNESRPLALPASGYTKLAVVGAHLSEMPLHAQLIERGARLLAKTETSKNYQLFALANTTPPKPGLARVSRGGSSIALEVYAIPTVHIGSFLDLIPTPLGLGNVELADGSWVKSFICEPYALENAANISQYGGWRAYIEHIKSVNHSK